MIEEILTRKATLPLDTEDKWAYRNRMKLYNQQFNDFKCIHGQYYMVKFGEDDIRPMTEDSIVINQLKEEIKSPSNTQYACPLCQPYDNWGGVADVQKNRRFMCRIVIPRYLGGAIDEEGTLIKCPCILKDRRKKGLKFKQGGKHGQ